MATDPAVADAPAVICLEIYRNDNGLFTAIGARTATCRRYASSGMILTAMAMKISSLPDEQQTTPTPIGVVYPLPTITASLIIRGQLKRRVDATIGDFV
ncbi:MAG: hypothetical protein R2867_13295 [Caldilineaceae bacterium]